MNGPSISIRGIYATALSALLPKHGFRVVQASEVIAERLGLPADGEASTRLRDRADHQAILLEGPSDLAEQAVWRLADLLPDASPRQLGSPTHWEVELPGGSKELLDLARASVWPTLPGHHRLKVAAGEAVDRAESALASGSSGADLAAELEAHYVERQLRAGLDVFVEHVKPGGRVLKLPGRIAELSGGRLRLTRLFRPGGLYDSLDCPKLAGDHGQVEQLAGSWVSSRRYLRASGQLIGDLYNIQTPTELYPWGVRYLDLEIDVAAWPDGRAEVVDHLELAEAVERRFVSPKLAKRAVEVAESVQAALARGEAIRLEDYR